MSSKRKGTSPVAARELALTEAEVDRLIRMAWEDRTTFEAIREQFGMTHNQVIEFMRENLDRKAFERWRVRSKARGHLKHEKTRGVKISRFKAAVQDKPHHARKRRS